MEKYLKTKIYLTLAVIAMVCYACSGNDKQGDDFTVYNTAVGSYYGNYLSSGTAYFTIDMYDAADDQIGVWFGGFSKLPSNFANFDVTGTYSAATTLAALTFIPGFTDDSGNILGTFIYNFHTNSFTLVTGGTYNIVLSNGKYVITTNFTGKDSKTGASVSNLKYSFTGSIAFQDKSTGNSGNLSFNDIVQSNYTATGTPSYMSSPGPASWTGQIIPSSGQDQFYDITGWGGGTTIHVYCDYKNGKIVMDNYTRVVHDDSGPGYDGYFQAVAIDNSAKTVYIVSDDYTVAYDKTNKILDFSGTHNNLPILVGVIAKNRSTNAFEGVFTELYANAKLKLTTVAQSSSSSMRAAELSCSASLSPEEFKGYEIVNESNMDKSKGRLPKVMIKK